ncbi:hypothetical protein MTO96_008453 [Rhipicephalus appendiculatus]
MLPIVAVLLAVGGGPDVGRHHSLALPPLGQARCTGRTTRARTSRPRRKRRFSANRSLSSTAKRRPQRPTKPTTRTPKRPKPSDSSVTLLSVTPREPEDGIALNGSFAELDQSRTASGRFAPEHRLMTSTPADGVSLCRSTGPQVHTAYPGRSLRYAPTSAMEADHTQSAASETSVTANPDKLVTRTIETTGSRSACTPTAITRREEATSENVEELSLSPMLWDYAGFEWPGKNREDVFTADVDPHTGSECSGVCCEDQEEEEDSDGHSSTSGVHRVLRKDGTFVLLLPVRRKLPASSAGPEVHRVRATGMRSPALQHRCVDGKLAPYRRKTKPTRRSSARPSTTRPTGSTWRVLS